MIRDLHHALRTLRRQPGFTVVAVLILALGLGATTAMFSVTNALVRTERVLASVIEAVIGACYLAYGYEKTAEAVVDAFAPEIEQALVSPADFKSALQERLARRGAVVRYDVVAEDGPPHDRTFEVAATVAGEEVGRGSGRSKKDAEQAAAASALELLGA